MTVHKGCDFGDDGAEFKLSFFFYSCFPATVNLFRSLQFRTYPLNDNRYSGQ